MDIHRCSDVESSAPQLCPGFVSGMGGWQGYYQRTPRYGDRDRTREPGCMRKRVRCLPSVDHARRLHPIFVVLSQQSHSRQVLFVQK